jgi:hypothetical protein
MNPSSTERVTLFDIVAKGDPEKEKKLTLLLLRIIHILYIATIPAAIIALTFILSSRDFVPSTDSGIAIVAVIVISYFFSLAMIFLGYKRSLISKWAVYINKLFLVELYLPSEYKNYMTVLTSHLFRTGLCFVLPVLFGFVLGILGSNLYLAIPLFILATIALILTYPTNRRLAQWLSEQESAK